MPLGQRVPRQRPKAIDEWRQRRVAVDEVAREQGDQAERQSPGPADERRDGEGHRARRQHQRPVQGGLAERRRQRDLIAGQSGECDPDDPGDDREDDHRDGDRQDVAAQLLDGDRAPGLRRRGHDIEAAPRRLAGERPRQGQDGPQPEDDGQGVPDAPGQEPAERLDIDRLAEQAAQGQRQGLDAADELLAELDRGEFGSGAERRARAEHEQAGDPAHDEGHPSAVADGLGEDRAQAHHP